MRLAAPAKVNLVLRVGGRRADGYHDVFTLLQAIDLCDEVEVVEGGDGVRLSVEGPDLGPPRENLAWRAARAFLTASGSGAGCRIRLVKRIPAGAGLGGGSSDGAAVLRALDTLHPGAVPPPRLHALAAALGADVPFFLGPTTLAVGTGRGDRLRALPALPPAHLVVVLPPVHVATAEAYRALARAPGGPPPAPAGDVDGWDGVVAAAVNDFQAVVAERHPPIAASLDALREEGADPALLTGSGAACFGVFAGRVDAEAAARRLEAALGWRAVAVRTLTHWPEPRP